MKDKSTQERKPNSQECCAFGRKLNNIACDDIEVSDKAVYLSIGSERDDEIYFPPVLKDGEEMLKERVKITVMNDDKEYCFDVDLEDVLRFAKKHCEGIYDRISDE